MSEVLPSTALQNIMLPRKNNRRVYVRCSVLAITVRRINVIATGSAGPNQGYLWGTNPRTPATGSALEQNEQGRQLSNTGPGPGLELPCDDHLTFGGKLHLTGLKLQWFHD